MTTKAVPQVQRMRRMPNRGNLVNPEIKSRIFQEYPENGTFRTAATGKRSGEEKDRVINRSDLYELLLQVHVKWVPSEIVW